MAILWLRHYVSILPCFAHHLWNDAFFAAKPGHLHTANSPPPNRVNLPLSVSA